METRHPAGQYITFQISGNYFALPAERIREMMPMQPLEPWGTDTPGVLGAVQSRGRLLPIFDLRNELQLRPRASSRQERLLIIKSHHEYEFGFPVDKVTDFVQVSSNDIRDEAIFGHGRMRAILDIDSIVNQERLFAAAFSRISLSRG